MSDDDCVKIVSECLKAVRAFYNDTSIGGNDIKSDFAIDGWVRMYFAKKNAHKLKSPFNDLLHIMITEYQAFEKSHKSIHWTAPVFSEIDEWVERFLNRYTACYEVTEKEGSNASG